MLALYDLSLSASAGLAGIFVRQVLGNFGLVHGFHLEVLLAGGAAFAYISLQLGYMTVVRVLKPTRSGGPLFAEALSHLGALALAPYLVGAQVQWPHPVLQKVEPLIYLGVFAAVHGFFKLVSFFAAIRGEPATRLGALGWMLATGLTGFTACAILYNWGHESGNLRVEAAASLDAYRIGNTYARARALPEGAQATFDIQAHGDRGLTMRWANLPTADENAKPDSIHVTVTLRGSGARAHKGGSATWSWNVNLDDSRWAELRIPPARIPASACTCSVVWDAEELPVWRKVLGIRSVQTPHRRVLLSGPFEHEPRGPATAPNVLLVLVEGLGARHLSCLGYTRITTPSLDGLAQTALVFPNAYTPAPEAAAACMTLLTGITPLRHGYLGARRGPLSREYQTLTQALRKVRYATAVFVDGYGVPEKAPVFGTDFARGFEVCDAGDRADPAASIGLGEPPGDEAKPRGPNTAIENAKAWIREHAAEKYFVLVRLGELRDPRWCARYAPGFVENPAKPLPVDVYDSALAYLDRELGGLIDAALEETGGQRTCIVVTSSYGLDFSAGPDVLPTVGLSEACLRVPVLLHIPGKKGAERPRFVALEDITPTLLDLTETGFDYLVDGRSLFGEFAEREPISMFGAPLALSLRVDRWRYSWQSGRLPFAAQATEEAGDIELYDVFQAATRAKRNVLDEHPERVVRYRSQLKTYLERFAAEWR